jgi:hypothetical protein
MSLLGYSSQLAPAGLPVIKDGQDARKDFHAKDELQKGVNTRIV